MPNPFADLLYRAFNPAPHAIMAYRVDHLVVMPPRVFCNRPDCVVFAARVAADTETPRLMVPQTQGDLDATARANRQPVQCDRCHAFLTDIVHGPDPRD